MQDGGMPHLGCVKSCCKDYFEKGFSKKRVVSLGVLDSKENKNYLIEASPDISIQLNELLKNKSSKLDGIFITHAHNSHFRHVKPLRLQRDSCASSRNLFMQFLEIKIGLTTY